MKRPSQDRYTSAAALRIGLRRFLSRTEKVTRVHGLTPERYELLLLIKTASDEKATVGWLGEQLSIGQSAATQLARRAENLGLIRRTVSPRDARVRPLHLTAEGEKRLARAVADLEKGREDLAMALTGLLQALQPAAS